VNNEGAGKLGKKNNVMGNMNGSDGKWKIKMGEES
jgi:hypothetical protein